MSEIVKRHSRSIRKAVSDAVDLLERWKHKRLEYPPKSLRDVGGDDLEDFVTTGEEFLHYFQDICHLSPSHDVLEVGCGCGRIAIPLSRYLGSQGSFTGIDIVPASIDWCNRYLASKFENFKFIHSDIFNARYNPHATLQAREYSFPFAADSFDFIYLTSVFTHLLRRDAEHYLREIRRVIRPQGVLFCTFFLLNDTQANFAEKGLNSIEFLEKDEVCAVRDFAVPESAIAYKEDYLFMILEQIGFSLKGPVKYGSWSGRNEYTSYQDILILTAKNHE